MKTRGTFIIISVFLQTCILLLYAQEPEKYQLKTVVIDAGHGGKDSGTRGKHAMEKDIVLDISLKLGKYIKDNIPDVAVIYTRTTDVFLPLHERAEIANKNHADLFISIHANADPKGQAHGTETFAMGLHKTQGNLDVAKKENSVILLEEDYRTTYEGFDPHSVESYIMFELVQNIHLEQSLSFASFVQDQFRERAQRRDRGVKQAGFLVLWRTTMPSVLIETGFLSHNNEEQYLISDQGQDYIASAIYRAFKEYKLAVESKSQYDVEFAEKDTSTGNYHTENTFTYQKPTNQSPPSAVKALANDSVIFRVQVVSASSPIPRDNPLYNEYNLIEIKTKNYYKYAIGEKYSYHEIKEYSKSLRNKFPDAFIIAMKGNEIIPLQEALKKVN
ncbi:MAG: N-acetylmuramoyl-L-alanine amidase [Bacteroidetes bacterium]|jgi:N-acetylmuramoyl-L-alanine amidase|nr:N-acetylmuramoyl-L-alanine amidase [Bacteroidota bacterium]